MSSISEIQEGDKKIIVADFSNKNEAGMLHVLLQLRDRIVLNNAPVSILSVYNKKNFATPKFMRAVEQLTRELIHLIDDQAIVGLSKVQKMILKGYNFLFDKNYQSFNTIEEAMNFLRKGDSADKKVD